jgi:23S rRNA (guanosine2251-2'-O)-methyltransferase
LKNFRKQQRPKKSSLIAGLDNILAGIRSGENLDRIYLDTKLRDGTIGELRKLASESGIPINYVPAAKLNSFNLPDHNGAIAQRSKVQYLNLQDLISFVQENGQTPLFLVLDGITDIRNIGGIARTAYAMGVHALIIPDKGVGALNEDALLTSAGALEKIPVCRVNSLMKAVDELHLNGIKVYATEMKADITVAEANLSIPCAIVMGSEEKGIYPALLKICDEKIGIPMPGEFESLNVSVATGIILYAVSRQRQKNDPGSQALRDQ